jgi:hypothetical protein
VAGEQSAPRRSERDSESSEERVSEEEEGERT